MANADSSDREKRRHFVKHITAGIAGLGIGSTVSAGARGTARSESKSPSLIYKTKAEMDADLGHPDGSFGVVAHDPNIANNGVYQKVGAAGTGTWTASINHAPHAAATSPVFQARGDGAVVRTVQEKLQDTVCILDYIPVSEHSGIYAGTSQFDCLPAFHAALANQRPHSSQGAKYGAAGPAIYVPAGTYHVSGAIEIKRRVRIHGDDSSMANSSEASRIIFPVNSNGFVIHGYNTIGAGVETPPSTQGSGSVLYGLQIEGTVAKGSKGHGVWLRAMATIEQCKVINWAENGIHIVAGARASAAALGNANGWSVKNVRITHCRGNAMYVSGADANAGVGYQVQCSSIDLWGIYDNSFLGNTYVGCMTEVCGRRSQVSYLDKRYYCVDSTRAKNTAPGSDDKVWVLVGAGGVNAESYPSWSAGGDYDLGGSYASINPNARNVFLGCYSEGGQPPSHILAPACVFGGFFGSTTPDSSAAVFRAGAGGAAVEGAISSVTRSPFGVNTSRLGGDGKNGDVLASSHSEFSPNVFRLRYSGHDLVWDYANLAKYVSYRITGPNHDITFGRPANIPCVFQADAIWLGNGNSARMQGAGVSPPKTGSHARGDYIRNSQPAVGLPKGWFCVEAGSPGTWISEGNL